MRHGFLLHFTHGQPVITLRFLLFPLLWIIKIVLKIKGLANTVAVESLKYFFKNSDYTTWIFNIASLLNQSVWTLSIHHVPIVALYIKKPFEFFPISGPAIWTFSLHSLLRAICSIKLELFYAFPYKLINSNQLFFGLPPIQTTTFNYNPSQYQYCVGSENF